tara:strand:+ start:5175 stop:6011 length:837 start_codon:yes stop_codon:yes gene_type:complete
MLTRINIKMCSFRKLDKKVTDDVILKHCAGVDAGRFNKLLIPKEYIAPVQKAESALRSVFYEETLPYDDSGYRVLPTENFLPFTQKINKRTEDFNDAADTLATGYQDAREEGRRMLNGMFKESDYPNTAEEVRNKFSAKVDFRDLPKGGNFMVDLGDEHVDSIREEIEARTNEGLAEAQKDIWRRLLEVTSHFASVMGDGGKVFRNSTVDNVLKICELAPRMNLSGDPELDELASQILSDVSNQSPDSLRKSKWHRGQVAERAKEHVRKIESAMEGAL